MTEDIEAARVAEFLKATFEAIDQAITIYDSDYRLVAWNERYEKLGLMPSRHVRYGASLLDAYYDLAHAGAFGDGDPNALAEQRVSSLRDGPLIEHEVMTGETGKSIRVRRFRLPNGGVCATLTDITEELETQEQLRQSSKMDAIGRLTGGVAHDMNNVLASVMGNLELEQETRDERSKYLTSAMESASRGAKLTHRLLAFARKQPLSPEITYPASLLKDLVSLLRTLLGEEIIIELICDAGLWQVEVDPHQLENVIVNIAINARDAMPGGGKLTIEAANTRIDEQYSRIAGIARGQYTCISATDTGAGIKKDVIEKAFEPFFTTKEVGEGTGLGLAMAHGFVRQSNGHIKLYSELGEGTTVKIYLPRAMGGEAATVAEIEYVSDPSASSKRILVVEDDTQFRETIRLMLSSCGYTVTAARDAAEAFEVFDRDNAFDLLLTDVVLPGGMNGRQLAETISRIQPEIRIIFMSGYSENAIIHHGRLDPGVVLIQKPFRKVDLIQEIVKATN